MLIRACATALVVLAANSLPSPVASAQDNAADKAVPALELKVYPIGDLVLPRMDHPFRSSKLPTVDSGAAQRPSTVSGGGFGGGGGLGGGGFGGGGGFFQVEDNRPAAESPEAAVTNPYATFRGDDAQSNQLSIDDIVGAITTLVEPESWEQNGGAAVIKPLGNLLLVRQTKAAHGQIEDVLRSASEAQAQPVTIDAHWLVLDGDQLDRLLWHAGVADPAEKSGDKRGIDRQTLVAIAKEVPSYRGRVTCFSDQTVHLVSGSRRTVVIGAIPTIGPYAVGYSLITAIPNVGLLLQVTPTVLRNGEALVDVESSFTRWGEQGAAVEVQSDVGRLDVQSGKTIAPELRGTASIDRVNMPAQQLGTTIRVPLGTPVLVGGMSLIDGAAGAEATKQLYLVIQVSAAAK